MRAVTIAVAAAFAMTAATTAHLAAAADWRVSGFFSQRLQADSDLDLGDGLRDGAVGSITDAGLTFTVETPRALWRLSPGVRLSLFSDNDSDTDNELEDLLPRFNGSVSFAATDRLTLTGSASVIPRLTSNNVTFLDFNDDAAPGEPALEARTSDETALELRTSLSTGLSYRVDTLNTANASLFLSRRDFVVDDVTGLEPTESFGASLGWRRAIDALGGVSIDGTARRFLSDGDLENDAFSLRAGVDRRVTPRLSGGISAGGTYIVNEDDDEDDAIAFTGGINARYDATRRTTVGASLFQDVDQDDSGTLVNRAQLSAFLRHRMDSRTTATLRLSVDGENPLFGENDGDDETRLSIAPGFSRSLTDAWSMNAGYRFRISDIEDSDRSSHLVFLRLSRNFDVLP